MKKKAALLVLILISTTVTSQQTSTPPAKPQVLRGPNSGIWPTYMGNFARNGLTTYKSSAKIDNFGLLWAYNASGPIRSSMSAADLNNDGLLDVAFGSDDGSLYVVSWNGSLLWKYQTLDNVRSTPTLSDLDGDGIREVVFGSDDRRLYALDSRGKLIWSFLTDGSVRTSPLVVDLGGIPGKEVVFGSSDGMIYCLSFDGTKIWEYKTQGPATSSPAISDLDGDGEMEIIVGSEDNLVYVLKNPPYKVWTYLTQGDVAPSPTVTTPKTIYVGGGDTFYRLALVDTGQSTIRRVKSNTGNLIMEKIKTTKLGHQNNYTVSGPIVSSAARGELFGKAQWGLAVTSKDRNLYLFDSFLKLKKRYSFSKGIESSAALADLNSDGKTDIVFSVTDGTIHVVNYPVGSIYTFNAGAASRSSPAIADLDGDGSLEVVVGCDNGVLYALGDTQKTDYFLAKKSLAEADLLRLAGDFNKSYALLEFSTDIFYEQNDKKGLAMSDKISGLIEADQIYLEAVKHYRDGNMTEAMDAISLAKRLYSGLNDEEGISKATTFSNILDAEKYLGEAKYLKEQGVYMNSSAYAAAAKTLYQREGDLEGVRKTDEFLKSFLEANGSSYVEFGLVARADGEYENAKKFFGLAKAAYFLAQELEQIPLIESLLNSVDAMESLSIAKENMRNRNFETARYHAEKASEFFKNTSEHSFQVSEGILSNASLLAKAQEHLDRARTESEDGDIAASLESLEKARLLFEQSGDSIGMSEVEKRKESGAGNWQPPLSLLMLAGVPALAALAFFGRKIIMRGGGLKLWKKQPPTPPKPEDGANP